MQHVGHYVSCRLQGLARAPRLEVGRVTNPVGHRIVGRRRLSDQVAETLREMILVGELAPYRSVTQDELASELGVSTTPAREALLRLAAEGFVSASPNRAFTVVRLTPADVQDVYWLHEILSAELASRACSRLAGPTRAELQEHADACALAVRNGDSDGLDKANWAFHRAINLVADAPRLQFPLTTTLKFIPRGFYQMIPSWAEQSLKDHEGILAALDAGDADGAAEATAAHVRTAGDALMNFLAESGYWKVPTGQ